MHKEPLIFETLKFIGEANWKGYSADQWQSVVVEGGKTNTYTFYVNAKDNSPLYYVIKYNLNFQIWIF